MFGSILTPADVCERIEMEGNIGKLYNFVEDKLGKREKEIIRLRYGLSGREVTQREIANKLGISRSYVSRIEKKALKKLRDAYESSGGK